MRENMATQSENGITVSLKATKEELSAGPWPWVNNTCPAELVFAQVKCSTIPGVLPNFPAECCGKQIIFNPGKEVTPAKSEP